MHTSVVLVLIFSMFQTTIAASDAKAIEAAKTTIVRRIEPSLPNKPFEKWLRELVGSQAVIRWEVNDCGEQTGNPSLDKGRDFPICAEAQATLSGNHKLVVSLSVGTSKSGVRSGPATFCYAALIRPDGSHNWVKSLAQLPEAIEAIK
jgi:hypothetical protein